MKREVRAILALGLSWCLLVGGCSPSRPYYLFETGDLSFYKGQATELEVPDVEEQTLDDVRFAHRPITLQNFHQHEFWDIPLEEVQRIALANSKVVRQIGGTPTQGTLPTTDRLLRTPQIAGTVYEPAIQESGVRFDRAGVETALSQFDAQLNASMFWERNERPINRELPDVFPQIFEQDRALFQGEIAKTAATGSRFFARHNVEYDLNNNPNRLVPSDYNINLEVGVVQPLLQGAGEVFNRIAGPGAPLGQYQGVLIARTNNDITLADFEAQVRNQLSDIEQAYWRLYYEYRKLEILRRGRDKALDFWQKEKAKASSEPMALPAGLAQAQPDTKPFSDLGAREAQARNEYFRFQGQLEATLADLLRAENRVRYLMGLAATDGRLLRPVDEPTTANVIFDWDEIHCEAIARSVELRRQKWVIKQRELELIAAKNYVLPRLDGVALYRWLGAGDDLIDPNGRGLFPYEGSDAWSTLTSGDYQEWQLGLQFNMPIGFRKELAGVRNAQLQLARERAVLQDQELEVSHLLAEALRNLESQFVLSETLFNKWMAARDEALVVEQAAELGAASGLTFNDVLSAYAKQAVAEQEYFASLVDYNKAIMEVHFRKGSLLEYNGVYLAEGPWPCKAYHDARRRARERDAGLAINYATTRPPVISRGPYEQQQILHSELFEGEFIEQIRPAESIDRPRGEGDLPPPSETPSSDRPTTQANSGPSVRFATGRIERWRETD